MPKRKPAPSATVISLSAARQARTEAEECCPYAVMASMIEVYSHCLSAQLEKIKAASLPVSSTTKGA